MFGNYNLKIFEMDEQAIQNIIKKYLQENLRITIEHEEDNEIDSNYLITKVEILLGDEVVDNASDSFRLSKR
jgi:low affinity Fe/Cu permease